MRPAQDLPFLCLFVTFGSGDVLGLKVGDIGRRLWVWRCTALDVGDDVVVQDLSGDVGDVANGSWLAPVGFSRTEGLEGPSAALEGELLAGAEEGRFTGESIPEKSHCQS